MENNYFKKGSYIAVQRLESVGITLPEPWYGPDEAALPTQQTHKVSSDTLERPSTAPAGAIRMVSSANNNEAGPGLSARYVNERYINKDVRKERFKQKEVQTNFYLP